MFLKCLQKKASFLKPLFILAFLLLCKPYFLNAQNHNQYHIDIYNGLPSNHVYQTLKDRYGYLWIATDKGVIRYNGYEFKLFNIANGLSNDDVYHLVEDKRGKIWLQTISDEFGYIYHDKYKSCFLKGITGIIYPHIIHSLGGNILFDANLRNDNEHDALYIVKNDTVTRVDINNIISTLDKTGDPSQFLWYVASKGITASNDKGVFYHIGLNGNITERKNKFRLPVNFTHQELCREIPIKNNLFCYGTWGTDSLGYIDSNGDCKGLSLPENDRMGILIPYVEHDVLFIITHTKVYEYDTNMRFIRSIPFSSLIDNTDESVTYFLADRFWDTSISTRSNGFFINYNTRSNLKKFNKFSLKNYSYIGKINDSTCYWWSKIDNTMAEVINNDRINYYKFNAVFFPRKIIPFNKKTSLLLDLNTTYWWDNKTKKVKLIYKDTKSFFLNKILTNPIPQYFIAPIDGICRDSTIYLILSSKEYTIQVQFKNNNLYLNRFGTGRIVYDSNDKTMWLYNKWKILIIDSNNKKTVVSKNMLKLLGVKEVQKILIDKYSNVFIKTYNKIYALNLKTNRYQQIFKNYNFYSAYMEIYNNSLIIAGKYGLLFSNITGPLKISSPIIYQNIKNLSYAYIDDMQVSDRKVLLKTDSGMYIADVPTDSQFATNSNSENAYQFVVNYGDSVLDVGANDTLLIDQKNRKLLFDVINPLGNGSLHYSYYLSADRDWQELNGNELNLPQLSADKYYTLSITTHDDAWQSDVITIHLFIVPYWWQTTAGSRIIWGSLILLLAIIIFAIVYVTKRILTNMNTRRNFQRDIELKSIYSQINPHFIFNSLNSGLLLIKKNRTDEAYLHIFRFSKLLRAYIKSSRNKYITLADEITNLKTYVDLQQTRFKNRFDFEIAVDENIDTTQIKIPSLLLQPIVENAINHGLFHKEEKGHLRIEFKAGSSKSEIICIVEDDGIGRKKAKLLKEDSSIKEVSYGDDLIKDLVSIFNKYEKMHILVKYTDKEEPLTGTIVELIIKTGHAK